VILHVYSKSKFYMMGSVVSKSSSRRCAKHLRFILPQVPQLTSASSLPSFKMYFVHFERFIYLYLPANALVSVNAHPRWYDTQTYLSVVEKRHMFSCRKTQTQYNKETQTMMRMTFNIEMSLIIEKAAIDSPLNVTYCGSSCIFVCYILHSTIFIN
jgi:hypothetical protein